MAEAVRIAEENAEVAASLEAAKKEVVHVIMEQFTETDDATATDIATGVVKEAVKELVETSASDEDIGNSVISMALFDLTQEELNIIYNMEDEVIKREYQIAEVAANTDDPEVASEANIALTELEGKFEQLVQAEDMLIAQLLGEDLKKVTNQINLDTSDVSKEVHLADNICKECAKNYTTLIEARATEYEKVTTMTDAIAEALSEIDPNMANGREGKALLRKLYRLRGEEPDQVLHTILDTPDKCLNKVSGKVLQLEGLEEDISKAKSFRDFFSQVYCSAYVNSLVTMKDGLSQIFPGGLDW